MATHLLRRAGWMLAAGLFLGSGLARAGDTPLARVEGAPPAPACAAASKEHALPLAQEAQREGKFRLAAACFHLAGEPVLADRALAQNFARTSAAAGERMNETIASAKQQAREIRDSLRRR